jgi:L-fuconolactonase
MRIFDSHLHFWAPENPGHRWPTAELPLLDRAFGAADVVAEAGTLELAGAVLVQAQPTDADTDWMLALATDEPLVQAVIGWVDLSHPDAARRIAALADDSLLRGLRPMLQSIEETEWLLRDDVSAAIEAMIDHGLRLDALIQPRHLDMLLRFVDRWPSLPVVIDHAAKPDMRSGLPERWAAQIAELAARGLSCKLSGLRTEQPSGQPLSALEPFVELLVGSFGERLMWGSDWPVLHLAGDTYPDWVAAADRLTGLTGVARDALFGDSARRFYGVADRGEARA